jgi:hypothetical protein
MVHSIGIVETTGRICKKISGKKIRKFRLSSKKTQRQFARELSLQTGEKIDVKTLCRMETVKKLEDFGFHQKKLNHSLPGSYP